MKADQCLNKIVYLQLLYQTKGTHAIKHVMCWGLSNICALNCSEFCLNIHLLLFCHMVYGLMKYVYTVVLYCHVI